MIQLLGIIGVGLLLFGLIEVWRGRWRPIWAAAAYAVGFAAICFTAELWFPLFGLSRGDGFILIGYFILGAGGVAVASAALVIAVPIHLLSKRRRTTTRTY